VDVDQRVPANWCNGQPTVQISSLWSSFLSTAVPLVSEYAPDAARLAGSTSSALRSPTTVNVPVDVAGSVDAMRARSRLDLQWQASFLAPIGSGSLTLNPPDQVDGEGTILSTTWAARTAQQNAEVQVDGKTVVSLPSNGLAKALRDALLSLPCYAPNLTARHDGGLTSVQGRLEPGSTSDLLKAVTGVVVPGSPIGEMTLTIDPGSKSWRGLDLRLIWAIVDVRVLGRQVTWGPSANVHMTFGGDVGAGQADGALAYREPSAARMLLGRIAGTSALSSVAKPVALVVNVLETRQAWAMLDEEESRRAAISNGWSRGGDASPAYQVAIHDYQAWERQIPLVGPFLHYLYPSVDDQ